MTLTETEISIYDLCEQGDRRAQMKLYDQYANGMYHVALRIVQQTDLAQDIMQESMISAFRKMNQWNRESTYGSWLKRIVINNSLSHLRKAGKMPTIDYEEVSYEMEQQPDDTGIDMEQAGMTARKVLEIMSELKENYRQVLTLSLIEGMDNEEICEILGLSNGQCRTMISRAKQSLRNKIEEYEG